MKCIEFTDNNNKDMSAKDYSICPALFNIYIAKTSKRDPNKMLRDRREITEQEIMTIINWWAIKRQEETGNKKQTITCNGQPVIEVTLL